MKPLVLPRASSPLAHILTAPILLSRATLGQSESQSIWASLGTHHPEVPLRRSVRIEDKAREQKYNTGFWAIGVDDAGQDLYSKSEAEALYYSLSRSPVPALSRTQRWRTLLERVWAQQL